MIILKNAPAACINPPPVSTGTNDTAFQVINEYRSGDSVKHYATSAVFIDGRTRDERLFLATLEIVCFFRARHHHAP